MSDDPRAILSDARAPADERYDAHAEMAKAVRPTASDILPMGQMLQMIRELGEMDMMKASSATVIPFPGEHRQPRQPGMQSVYVDEMQIFVSGAGRTKPSPLGFPGLRQMVETTPILGAIVGTRIRQIGRFCAPSEDGGEGFEIRHMDRQHKLTGAEKEQARLITRFIRNCGWEFNPRRRKSLKRATFAGLMRASVRDSLSFDACPLEVQWKRDKNQGIDGFYAVDGATITLATEEGYEGDDEIIALQEVDGRVATTYTLDNLIYEVRNPRTDVRLAGYGYGETEQLLRVVTGFLNAMTMNISGFDKNSIPRGILHLSGDYAEEDIAAFKRSWNAMVQGINGRWALPVMVSKEGETKSSFENFNIEFNEMMFAKWMTFLTSIACAIYGMAPDEINFESFASSRSTLSGSDTEEKLTSSRDLGLHPDMSFYESMLTDFVVSEFNQDLCFRWVGLREEDKAWDQETKKLVLKVDELRAEQGYEKWGGDSAIGEAPINPTLIAPWQAEQQAKNPPPGQDFGGPPPAPGPDFGNPDDNPSGQDTRRGTTPGGVPGESDAQAGQKGAADTEGAKPEFGGGDGKGDFGKSFTGGAVLPLLQPIYVIGDE